LKGFERASPQEHCFLSVEKTQLPSRLEVPVQDVLPRSILLPFFDDSNAVGSAAS